MAKQIFSLGELLVEVMRPGRDQPLEQPGLFAGPFASGAPAIFIDAAARMGAHTAFAGVVGADGFGALIRARLCMDGVDTALLRVADGRTTGVAFVSYRADGSRSFIFHLAQSAAAALSPADLPPGCVETAAFVHVVGSSLTFSEGTRLACYEAVRRVKAAGGRVSFDPNLRPELLGIEQVREIAAPVLAACDVLLPSGEEARLLTGSTEDDSACRALVARGIAIVALKRGAAGSTIYTPGEVVSAAPYAVTEVDPTGAGDCFGGAFIAALLEGMELREAARFANIAGALSVTRLGPMEGIPTRAEVLRLM